MIFGVGYGIVAAIAAAFAYLAVLAVIAIVWVVVETVATGVRDMFRSSRGTRTEE
jgi:hypothetical protein